MISFFFDTNSNMSQVTLVYLPANHACLFFSQVNEGCQHQAQVSPHQRGNGPTEAFRGTTDEDRFANKVGFARVNNNIGVVVDDRCIVIAALNRDSAICGEKILQWRADLVQPMGWAYSLAKALFEA